jgi:hypothetical protein
LALPLTNAKRVDVGVTRSVNTKSKAFDDSTARYALGFTLLLKPTVSTVNDKIVKSILIELTYKNPQRLYVWGYVDEKKLFINIEGNY